MSGTLPLLDKSLMSPIISQCLSSQSFELPLIHAQWWVQNNRWNKKFCCTIFWRRGAVTLTSFFGGRKLLDSEICCLCLSRKDISPSPTLICDPSDRYELCLRFTCWGFEGANGLGCHPFLIKIKPHTCCVHIWYLSSCSIVLQIYISEFMWMFQLFK